MDGRLLEVDGLVRSCLEKQRKRGPERIPSRDRLIQMPVSHFEGVCDAGHSRGYSPPHRNRLRARLILDYDPLPFPVGQAAFFSVHSQSFLRGCSGSIPITGANSPSYMDLKATNSPLCDISRDFPPPN
jgi:hypothetical protein